MFRCDCYWMNELQDHGAGIYICDRYRKERYDPECAECNEYITAHAVKKIVRSTANMLRNDLDMKLIEVEDDE